MIREFWIYHCGFALVPQRAIFADGALLRRVELAFLGAMAVHAKHGPLLIDAPKGVNARRQTVNLRGALLKTFLEKSSPAWSVVRRLEQMGQRPEDVQHVLLTHLHYHHTGALCDLPNAKVHVSEQEWSFAQGLSVEQAGEHWYALEDWRGLEERVETHSLPMRYSRKEEGLDLFGDGSVEMLSLPGHSPGHAGWRFRMEDGRSILFAGDAIFHQEHVEGRGLGRIPQMVAYDPIATRHTLQELRDARQEDPSEAVYCSHDYGLCRRCMEAPRKLHG